MHVTRSFFRSYPLPSDGSSKKSSPVRSVRLIGNHKLTLSHGLQALLCPSQHEVVVDAFLNLINGQSFPFLSYRKITYITISV